MKVELTDVFWLDAQQQVSLTELVGLSGLSEAELQELVDFDIIVPVDAGTTPLIFRTDCIVTARTACRLRNDFELDAPGLALALTLLGRIHDLEAQLRELSARLPHAPR